MSRVIDDEWVEPVARTLLGAIDVDSMDAFAPDQAAYAVTAEDQRDPGLHIARTLVRTGAEAAMTDYMRFIEEPGRSIRELSLRDDYGTSLDAPDAGTRALRSPAPRCVTPRA